MKTIKGCSVPAMKVIGSFKNYEEDKMDKEKSIFIRPKARQIKIEETVTGGFIVSVGCKRFAFGPSAEEITRLSEYLRTYLLNPQVTEKMSDEASRAESEEVAADTERVELTPEEDEIIRRGNLPERFIR